MNNFKWILKPLYIIVMLLCANGVQAETAQRPFWTEKSAYLEQGQLYVVGIASQAATVEAGRQAAFEHGQQEIRNFMQLADINNIVIETQMTYEEADNGKYRVYRLLKTDYAQLSQLKATKKQTVVQAENSNKRIHTTPQYTNWNLKERQVRTKTSPNKKNDSVSDFWLQNTFPR